MVQVKSRAGQSREGRQGQVQSRFRARCVRQNNALQVQVNKYNAGNARYVQKSRCAHEGRGQMRSTMLFWCRQIHSVLCPFLCDVHARKWGFRQLSRSTHRWQASDVAGVLGLFGVFVMRGSGSSSQVLRCKALGVCGKVFGVLGSIARAPNEGKTSTRETQRRSARAGEGKLYEVRKR